MSGLGERLLDQAVKVTLGHSEIRKRIKVAFVPESPLQKRVSDSRIHRSIKHGNAGDYVPCDVLVLILDHFLKTDSAFWCHRRYA